MAAMIPSARPLRTVAVGVFVISALFAGSWVVSDRGATPRIAITPVKDSQPRYLRHPCQEASHPSLCLESDVNDRLRTLPERNAEP
jgi:hypothetical protein